MAVFRKKDKKGTPDPLGEEQLGVLHPPDQGDDFWGEAKQHKGIFRRLGREVEPFHEEGLPPIPVKPVVEPYGTEELGVIASAPLEEVVAAPAAEKKDFSFEVKKPTRKVGPAAVEVAVQRAPVAEKLPIPRKEKRPRRDMPIALQMPGEYEGMMTDHPLYLKAALWGLLAGAVGAGVYAGLAWWGHREYGIIGWLIGIAVGLAVVFASGRHFSWKLGLIAAGISMFFLCVGRILVYMLDVWFPDIIKLPVSTMDNFNHALTQFFKQLPTMWLLIFFITGAVAFLISFRPWPIRFQASGTRAAVAPQKSAE
jgi:hypothetical protein